VFILFPDKSFTVNFTLRFIDGLNVTGVVNRVVLHRDLFNQELWSLSSNIRFRASHFFVSGSRTIWSKKQEKYCIICIITNSVAVAQLFPSENAYRHPPNGYF